MTQDVGCSSLSNNEPLISVLDAFIPFADTELATQAGISAIIRLVAR